MTKVRWLDRSVPASECCPICGSTEAKVVLEAQDYRDPDLYRPLARCEGCSSFFFVGMRSGGQAEHYDGEALIPNATQFAFELQTGMQLFVDVISRVPGERFSNYLEVGCGAGVAVDFVSSYLGKRAVGVEPSVYGEEGARQLGSLVYTRYLDEVAELADEKFGLVASFEVVEHTYDPAAFLATLKRKLRPDGVLVITTPNAEAIKPESPEGIVYPALFPGEHKVILTPVQLERLLREAGFDCVHSASTSHQLIYYASAAPFSLVQAGSGDAYADYLVQRLERFDAEGRDSYVVGAYLFRLVAELVGRGRFEEAEPYVERLLCRLALADGASLAELRARVRRAAGGSFNDYGEQFPYYLGALMYFLGIFYWGHRQEPRRAQQFFQAASEIIAVEVGLDPSGFVWPATMLPLSRLNAGCAAIEAGELRQGCSTLWRLVAERGVDGAIRRRALSRLIRGSWRALRKRRHIG